jgi:hypothetical protein
VTGAGDGRFEKVLGHADAQTGPVAGQTVGIDRAAVPDRFQGVDGQFHNIAAGAPLHVGDQADTAGIALVLGTPQTRAFEQGQAGPRAGLIPGLVCHSAAPRT